MGVVMLPCGTAKTTFSSLPLVKENFSGRSFSRETPFCSGPRQNDQFRVAAGAAVVAKDRTSSTRSVCLMRSALAKFRSAGEQGRGSWVGSNGIARPTGQGLFYGCGGVGATAAG